MENFETVPVLEACLMLGMSRETLWAWMRSEKCPFGSYIKTGEKRGSYYINRNRLEMYLAGVDMVKCPVQCNVYPAMR